jgi:uncharacterized delta-60 repeat protein
MFQFGMLKLLENGALDSSFGAGGKVATDFGIGQSEVFAMVVRDDGRIVLGGYLYAEDGSESNVALARYHADGSLDTSFGGTGMVVDDLGGYDDAARAMMMTSAGLVVAGNSNDDFMVGRYLEDGSRDSAFASGGVFVADFAGGVDNAMAVTAVGNKILAAGFATGATGNEAGLLMLNSDGTVDEEFGPAGELSLDLASGDDSAQAIIADGYDALIAGFSFNGISDNDVMLARLNVTPPNEAPIADAGGGYSVDEGGQVMLSGAGSIDSDGTIVSYEWDLDYDGVNFDGDAGGDEVSFSAAGLDGPTTRTVALRVTDDDGAVHMATALVSVMNVAPVVKLVMPPAAVRGQELTFHGRVDDPGMGDLFVVSWDFGDGTVLNSTRDAAGLLSATHTFTQAGVYAVKLTAMDDDGGMHSLTRTMSVAVAGLQTSPTSPNQTVLVIGGTTGDDVIKVVASRSGESAVYVNNQYYGTFNGHSRITVYGQGGNDRVILSGPVKQPTDLKSMSPKKNDKGKK